MKFILVAVFILPLTVLSPNVLVADSFEEARAEADQYYAQGSFSTAFKKYQKLAKEGDFHSQEMVSRMYAKGEGKSVNLIEAYAWSVLAAESGEESRVLNSQALLQRVDNPAKAKKKAGKLVKKYGRKTQERKAAARDSRDPSRCIGSLLACKRR